MKAIIASICLVAAVCLTAHAVPQQEGQTYYAAELQHEWGQGADTVSELEFRRMFLLKESGVQVADDISVVSDPDTAANVVAPECDNAFAQLKKFAQTLPDQLARDLGRIPGASILVGILRIALAPIAAISSGLNSLTAGVVRAIRIVIGSIKLAIRPFEWIPGIRGIVKRVRDLLTNLEKLIDAVTGCKRSMSQTENETEAVGSQCYILADVYRGLIKDALTNMPAPSASASDDQKRVAAGSAMLLDFMDKYSIATSNDALLSSRPIFSADLLDQYRQELINLGETDEVKEFARINLALTISMSNALEACLKLSADPTAAMEAWDEDFETSHEVEDEVVNEVVNGEHQEL
ncbi:hypothetical protein BCR41DRAFT_392905 [Lobosporangium transversale]|nr:hypothetical protein BCR41DRAFT_392905 [Lobosporangium transversale]ORZ26869.1 hypothetical protein BCR41DRAFT_392905 [Lobosporangium transversale]|eukprot:XP_021884616.1 hypothetical protein BCR41DRAFT_392905 [Lobosporangium transversale]